MYLLFCCDKYHGGKKSKLKKRGGRFIWLMKSKLEKKGSIWLMVQTGQNLLWWRRRSKSQGKYGRRNRMQVDHICTHTGSREQELKQSPQRHTSSSRVPPPQGSTTPQAWLPTEEQVFKYYGSLRGTIFIQTTTTLKA